MAAFRDEGHMSVANKPLRLRLYRSDKLPCPVQHAGCVILVNDRHDAERLRLALSDGSSWTFFVREGDVGSQAVAVRPTEVDLMPAVRAAIAAELPDMLPQPVKVIEHARETPLSDLAKIDQLREDIKVLAAADIEIGEHLGPMLRQIAELMARVEFIEQNALARARLEVQ
jgi:hypothetical protein